eukprot:COSAG06_NODE_12442_length_1381_cov_0.994540_1_plen_191_part_00
MTELVPPMQSALPSSKSRRFSVSLNSGDLSALVQEIEVETEPADGSANGELISVACPEGVESGKLLYVMTPDGREVEVVVPEGVGVGDEFEVCVGEAMAEQKPVEDYDVDGVAFESEVRGHNAAVRRRELEAEAEDNVVNDDVFGQLNSLLANGLDFDGDTSAEEGDYNAQDQINGDAVTGQSAEAVNAY